MCHLAMTPFGVLLPVYNKKLCLQQILRKPKGGPHAHRRISDQRAGSGIPELRPAVVACGDDPHNFASLGLLQ